MASLSLHIEEYFFPLCSLFAPVFECVNCDMPIAAAPWTYLEPLFLVHLTWQGQVFVLLLTFLVPCLCSCNGRS